MFYFIRINNYYWNLRRSSCPPTYLRTGPKALSTSYPNNEYLSAYGTIHDDDQENAINGRARYFEIGTIFVSRIERTETLFNRDHLS